MRDSSREIKQGIQCVEVLVSRNYVGERNHQLSWTLSVYSLQNHPVRTNHDSHNSEMFHFMLYDWKRSVKKLLDDQQIPYSIVGYFCPASIHGDEYDADVTHRNSEEQLLSALNDLSEISEVVEQRTQGGRVHQLSHEVAPLCTMP
jgi:hypothetical protein